MPSTHIHTYMYSKYAMWIESIALSYPMLYYATLCLYYAVLSSERPPRISSVVYNVRKRKMVTKRRVRYTGFLYEQKTLISCPFST